MCKIDFTVEKCPFGFPVFAHAQKKLSSLRILDTLMPAEIRAC
jgi:hypothetical protein